jgi:antirestriction protein ArdC
MADIKLSKTKQQLYDAVVAEMKKGELPWNKPWHGGPISAPENATTGARYKGINNILLFVEALRNEYTDNRWATFKQIQDNGWHLIKGSKGVPIEFYSKYDVVAKKKMNDRDIKALTAGMSEADAAAWEKQHIKTIGDTYIVFNAAQIEGIKQRDALTVTAEERNLQCENFIAASECPIFYDQVGRAYYDATKDEIHLPTEADFKSLTDRYATTFHEMAHSSGAEKRLNRDMSGVFLTPSYAKEELRAEVASMFLQQEYGVDMQQRSLANHSSYLQGWLNVITDNPNELFNAFHDASKIANYLVLNERAYTKEHAAQRSVEAAAVTQTMSIAQQSQPQDAPAYTDYYKAYLDVERKNPDAIVATRLGDFYEVMGDKAQVAADILDLILVTRDVANGVRVPMTGFPARIADNYIETLNKTHDVVILEDGTVRTLANTSLAAERAAEDFLLDEYLDSASNHEFTIENNLHNLELPSFIREETARKIVEYANTKTEKELCAEYQVLCAMSRVVNEELSYAVGMDDISEEHYVREQVFSKLSQVEMSQEMFSKFGQLEVSQQELNSLYPELVDKYARHLSEGTLETYGWDTDSVKNSIISYLPSEYQALVEQEKSAQKSVEAAAATQTTNIEQQSEPQDAPAYTDYYKAYLDVERKNPDAIVATRLGDFYEVMGDKAQAVAFFLDLALVTRQVADGVRVPMAGFPAYASDNYLSTLTEIHDVVILEDGAVSTMKRRDNTASATNVSRAISMGDIHDEMIFDALNRAKEGDFSDIANSNSFSFNEFWDVYWIKAEKATSTQIGVSYEKVERKLFKTTRTDEILWLDKDNVKVENGYLTEVKLATLIGSVAYTDQLVSHSSLKSTYNKWLEQSKTPRKVAEDTPEKRADYASKLQQWDDYNKLMALQAARRAEEDLRLEEYQAAAEKREFATNNNLHNLEVPDLVDIADATKIVEYANTKTAKELCAEYLVVCAMSKVVNDELSYAVGMDGLSNELYAREQMFSKFSQVEMSQQELNSLYPALVDKYARYLGGGALETYGWEDASVAKSIVSYLPSEYQALARQEELVEKRATQAKEYARLTEKYGNIDFETQLYVSTYWTENLNTNERTYSLYEIDPNSEDGEKITRTKTPINFAELNTFGKELHLIEDEYDYQQLRDIAADTELYATLKQLIDKGNWQHKKV